MFAYGNPAGNMQDPMQTQQQVMPPQVMSSPVLPQAMQPAMPTAPSMAMGMVPGPVPGGTAATAAGQQDPVDALKELQRSDATGREQWGAYCDERAGGVRDPGKHTPEFVRGFLTQYETGNRVAVNPGPLSDMLKTGQRSSAAWKQAWAEYCQAFGGGIQDPVKHDQKFLTSFIDFLGQSALMALNGMPGGSHQRSQQRPYQQQQQRPPHQQPRRGKGGGRGGSGNGGGGGGSDGREKDRLVQRIKAFQRMSEEAKNAWGEHCDFALGGVRDPRRHDCKTLTSFCDAHRVP